jgi:hypothetical protein
VIVSEMLEVSAREGRVRVAAGPRVRIDVESGQVADTWAFVDGNPASTTRLSSREPS